MHENFMSSRTLESTDDKANNVFDGFGASNILSITLITVLRQSYIFKYYLRILRDACTIVRDLFFYYCCNGAVFTTLIVRAF